MSSKASTGKPEVKTGGMKPSASAPSSLPSAKTSSRSLFDDDDLFAPTKESRYSRSEGFYYENKQCGYISIYCRSCLEESTHHTLQNRVPLLPAMFHLSSCCVASSHSQNKPQRVALLFEDEDDEYNGSLFGIKPAVNTSTAAPPANVSLCRF